MNIKEKRMKQKKQPMTGDGRERRLRRRFTGAVAGLLIAFLAAASATYAWYIYNTGRHTTNVRMAAGAGANLQISNTYDGVYGSAAVLDSFTGRLVPVSTNRIRGGFQKAEKFVRGADGQPVLVAGSFEQSGASDYYHTSLFLRTNADPTDIYLSDIGFEDSDEQAPISTAIRVGLVVHQPGQNQADDKEMIFSISDKKNPEAEYNTRTGAEGYVLDSTKTDGTTVLFTPCNEEDYCIYNKDTGEVILKDQSRKLCTVSGNGSGQPGEPVEIEVFIWLEGCDEDCTANLCEQTLKNLALSFAGKQSLVDNTEKGR